MEEAFSRAPVPLPDVEDTIVDPTSPEMREHAREQIYQATQTIPDERKAAYLEAREKASYLFENESDPYRFLLTCDFNIWQAAQRMALYWEERLELFGPYRAFLPLTLTGDGALMKEDIQSLQGGFPAFLPDNCVGQKVMYCDRRQWLATTSVEQRLRTIFYLVRVWSDDERTIQEGTLVLILLVTPRITEIELPWWKRVLHLVLNAFPVKIAHWHLLNVPPKHVVKIKKQYKMQDIIVSYITSFMDNCTADNIDVHFEREPGEICYFLQNDLGMSLNGIPREFGGTWDFTRANSWCRTQTLQERETYKRTLQALKQIKRAAPRLETSKGDKVSKRRANNAMHSKRKRERRLQEAVNLTREHDHLVQENADLKQEQARLEELLKQAKQMVTHLATSTNPASANGITGQLSQTGRSEESQLGRVEWPTLASSPIAYNDDAFWVLDDIADLPLNPDPLAPNFMHSQQNYNIHGHFDPSQRTHPHQQNRYSNEADMTSQPQFDDGGYAPSWQQQQQNIIGGGAFPGRWRGSHQQQDMSPTNAVPRPAPSVASLARSTMQCNEEDQAELLQILLQQQQQQNQNNNQYQQQLQQLGGF